MLLGAALIFGALSLFIHNQREATNAGQTAGNLLPVLIEKIEEKEEMGGEPLAYTLPVGTPIDYLDPSAFEMTEVEINGHAYIGYLSIPKLELDLPIISNWSYPMLRKAPCRYVGTVRGEDLVLVAHNYASHFGKLSQLEAGDSVTFTDMDGEITCYEVVGEDILPPTAVEEMTAGIFDLTLFTCTYGGKHRFTIYCDRVDS